MENRQQIRGVPGAVLFVLASNPGHGLLGFRATGAGRSKYCLGNQLDSKAAAGLREVFNHVA